MFHAYKRYAMLRSFPIGQDNKNTRHPEWSGRDFSAKPCKVLLPAKQLELILHPERNKLPEFA